MDRVLVDAAGGRPHGLAPARRADASGRRRLGGGRRQRAGSGRSGDERTRAVGGVDHAPLRVRLRPVLERPRLRHRAGPGRRRTRSPQSSSSVASTSHLPRAVEHRRPRRRPGRDGPARRRPRPPPTRSAHTARRRTATRTRTPPSTAPQAPRAGRRRTAPTAAARLDTPETTTRGAGVAGRIEAVREPARPRVPAQSAIGRRPDHGRARGRTAGTNRSTARSPVSRSSVGTGASDPARVTASSAAQIAAAVDPAVRRRTRSGASSRIAASSPRPESAGSGRRRSACRRRRRTRQEARGCPRFEHARTPGARSRSRLAADRQPAVAHDRRPTCRRRGRRSRARGD